MKEAIYYKYIIWSLLRRLKKSTNALHIISVGVLDHET